MNPDTSAAVTAIATCVLAGFAFLAFAAAALTYWAQARQLRIAKDEARRLQAPILRAEVNRDGQGFPAFRLDVTLLSHEPVPWVRVIGVYSEGMLSGHASGDQSHNVGLAFECQVTGGQLHADEDEITDLRFMSVAELQAQPPVGPGTAQLWHDLAHPETWPLLR